MTSGKITFSAASPEVSFDDQTRTVIDGDKLAGFNTVWHNNDKLGVYSFNADVPSNRPYAYTRNARFDITSIVDGVATFAGEITFDGYYRVWELYAYYPRNAANNSDNSDYKSVPASISRNQTMRANGTHDSANDYMVSLPGPTHEIDANRIYTATVDNFHFRYLVGFMNLAVKDITAAGVSADETVTSVKITAGSDGELPQIAGNFNLDLTDGAMTFTSASNEVTVELPVGVTLGELDAWAVVNPFTADRLTFLITTDKHTIEKTATTDHLRGDFDIEAGRIKTFEMAIDEDCTITDLRPIELLTGIYRGPQGYGDENSQSFALRFFTYDPNAQAFDQNGFQLDLIVVAGQPLEMGPDVELLDLANTTYLFDNYSAAGNTVFNHQYLTYIMTVENGRTMAQKTIANGSTMTVEGDRDNYHITFDITRTDGIKVKAEYNGPLNIPNRHYVPVEINFGTLNHISLLAYGHDIYQQGYDLWSLQAASSANVVDGWGFYTQFCGSMMSSATPIPDGTYTVSERVQVGTVLWGYRSGGIRGSWLVKFEGGDVKAQYPLVSGTVRSAFANGEYTIEVNAKDDRGSIITGTVQGNTEMQIFQ